MLYKGKQLADINWAEYKEYKKYTIKKENFEIWAPLKTLVTLSDREKFTIKATL